MSAINGATRLYGIVGHPIVQVKSPELYGRLFVAAGMNAVMIPLHVLPEQFDQAIAALMGVENVDGLIVTVPYKARAVAFATRLGPTASRIRALNALRREPDGSWTGDMFDGAGFVRAAQIQGQPLRGRKVALFGAGGAGSAIACELLAAGVASIAIMDVRSERANALARALREAFPACRVEPAAQVPADADMIVNASTVGMLESDGMPGELGALRRDTLVGDVVISEAPTAIIRHALQHGCAHVTGRDMLAGQSDALMSFFTRA
ncbi:MAG TPA: shikimate dehydrogenase [Casimicrobiaceae bacterium]|nr:shikimate dehydrogenase [Casimicrobiaceae bacterium]